MLDRFGSPPIRNAGTLGGNIANGSPIGDTMPALFVLNAEIELAGPRGTRRVNINEFYTGYRKNVHAARRADHARDHAAAAAGDEFRLYKISKRRDLDISTFTAAIWMHVERDVIVRSPHRLRRRRPRRSCGCRKTEAWLCRAAADGSDAATGGPPGARAKITPISDVRGSAEYRSLLAENILRQIRPRRPAGTRSTTAHWQ